jgi:hypothetical protein
MPSVTSKPQNPVEYAEQHLDVHGAYERAEQARSDYDTAMAKANGASAAIRHVHEMMASRERDRAVDQRAANPTMSATAFGQHMKEVLQADDKMEEYRLRIIEEQGKRDDAEAQAESAKYRMKIETSRLVELGGLLNFYAAAKYVTTQNLTERKNA